MKKIVVAKLDDLDTLQPAHALVANVDLVLIRFEDDVSVLFGRCLHRGAMLSDGFIDGDNLICGLHNWDYNYKSGVSAYNNEERLKKFSSWIDGGNVLVDEEEIAEWERKNPQPFDRGAYLGQYADVHGGPEEPHNRAIQHLARFGLGKSGHHGPVEAMGVPGSELPQWKDIQLLTAQLARPPLLDDDPVATEVVIGPGAKRPLRLEIPLFVSDMSFGALSKEAKVALSRGAELAGTGICSGEGGMLDDEQAANSRYFYELASARFGYRDELLKGVQAFHFKAGQAAKTGTGGHLPGDKVRGQIAQVRGLEEGQPAVSPARFTDMVSVEDYRRFGDHVRDVTGGIPVGFKMSAQHIEEDIDFALAAGADYIILDGRGGGTGAAPLIFRDNISVPTIPALARARRHLDDVGAGDVTLVITGGLRLAGDFIKALCLGADAVAIANSALQAIGCLGMRACHTNNCPVGIATQKDSLRRRLKIETSARQLGNFLSASVELMKVMARACGHSRLGAFEKRDIVSWNSDMARLAGIAYAGVGGSEEAQV